jgi:hypothetical protein
MLQRKVHRSPPAVLDRTGPPWRLLVESPDPVMAISDFDAYRRAGFDVTVCEGPVGDAGECPVVRGEPCPLVTEADVVLFDLDSDPPRRGEMLAAIRATRPELPIVVCSTAPAPTAAGGCAAIRPTTSVNGQVGALRKAVLQWPSLRS